MIQTIAPLLSSMVAALPANYRSLVAVIGLAILIVLYALFIWKFHRFITKKNILKLNLMKYNQSEHPVLNKIGAVFFYFIEYIVILPFLIFFWFTIFALIIFFMLENATIITALNLAAAIVAAIRILAYHNTVLAEEVAKLFPLTLLVVFIAKGEITPSIPFAEIATQLPHFFAAIAAYFVFIAGLELLLRTLDLIFDYQGD